MKKYLLTPGPVEIPEEVRLASQRPLIGHRTSNFSDLFISIQTKLSQLLEVDSPSIILPSSGTGALECLAVNFLSKNDTFISASCGIFGDRFRTIAEKTGAKGIYIDFELGTHIQPEIVRDTVINHPECKVLLLTQNETSTGVINPIKEIIEAIPSSIRPIILVDGVSSIGTMESYPQKWGIDGIATASQKGLMCPPGLGILWISNKGWNYTNERECPSYYFDLKLHRKEFKENNYANPYTPPVTLYFALEKALDIILSNSKETWFKSHRTYSKALAAGVEELGFKLLTSHVKYRSPGVTAIKSDKFEMNLIKDNLSKLGIITAGGQGTLKDKLIRIAHYDDKSWPELSMILSCLYAATNNQIEIKSNFLAKPLEIFMEG
ncbi:MAG: alanine--glyoxylate aminotransferase family protein [Synergistaceae bacterium]